MKLGVEEFQFLLVRLKVKEPAGIDTKIFTFQFLLVRLKGFRFKFIRVEVLISIPSGTIKRSIIINLKLKNVMISIPSGTIKSFPIYISKPQCISISIPSGTIKRLTGGGVSWLFKLISIPSGTIKREGWDIFMHFIMLFQFLLVRLKGAIR